MNNHQNERDLPHIVLEDYQIIVASLNNWTEDIIDLTGYSSLFILVDTTTKDLCLPVLMESKAYKCLEESNKRIEVIEMGAGESFKNLATCEQVWQQLMDKGADRKSLMINLGGGVVGDLGGFCASTFMRGMDFIQVPTTLLAMADASVGGKVGVDFHHVKNYIGLFCQPQLVWIDPVFLESLPHRHLLNGMAEIIKHALIEDVILFDYLEKTQWTLKDLDWTKLLLHSVQIKADIVRLDIKENGVRKKLNFGHTIGHALESQSLKTGLDVLHGEAIAAGMIIESFLSIKKLGLPLDHFASLEKLLLDRYEKLEIGAFEFEDIQKLIGQDKKKTGNRVGYTLIEKIGKAHVDIFISEEDLYSAVKYYKEL